jgi:hypothetical protein
MPIPAVTIMPVAIMAVAIMIAAMVASTTIMMPAIGISGWGQRQAGGENQRAGG